MNVTSTQPLIGFVTGWLAGAGGTKGAAGQTALTGGVAGGVAGVLGSLVSTALGDVPFSKFAEMLGGYGEEVREPAAIGSALRRAREEVNARGKSAVINIWVDPNEYAPGTKAQTMYK